MLSSPSKKKLVFTHLAHYVKTQPAIAEGVFELWEIQKSLKLQQSRLT